MRDEHAARFGYDLDAIMKDLKNQEVSGRKVVALEPKLAPYVKGAA